MAIVLAPRFERVRMWVFEQDLTERIASTRENDVYLPGFQIPENVAATSDIEQALAGSSIVLGVMPSHHARGLYTKMLPFLEESVAFVSATKGIENGSLLRISQVMEETLSSKLRPRIAVLSGPTFAREIAQGEPAALVVSSSDPEYAEQIRNAFSGPSFRLYSNTDPIGVEVGAALKNVIAIGAGVCQGLSLGNNTMAALITRGLAEITRLAIAMGGQPRTLAGLAGLGDLVLTCNGALSRNRSVGIELARGRKLEDIINSTRMVAEGVQTTYAAIGLAQRHNVEMPITTQMYAILKEGRPPRAAIRELMERELKGE